MLSATAAAAAGTIAAVVVALRQVGHERKRALHAEQERDQERAAIEAERTANRRAARTAQALRVVAYPRWKVDGRTGAAESGHWQVRLGNYSDAPVFDVVVETFVGGLRVDRASQQALTPNADSLVDFGDRTDRGAPPECVLYFRDVAGVHWKREQTGGLVEVDEHRNPIERVL